MSNSRRLYCPCRWRARIAESAWFAALIGISGCSLAIDTDQVQCTRNADCQQGPTAMTGGMCVVGLCEVAERWQCLNELPTALSKPDAPASVQLELPMRARGFELADSGRPAFMEVSLCHALDLQCESPMDQEVSDWNNLLRFEVPPEFNGYVQLQGPDLVPVLYFLPPVHVDNARLPEAEVWSTSLFDNLMNELEVTQKTESGMVHLATRDCLGGTAAGVSYNLEGEPPTEIDADIRPFYDVSGVPSLTAEATDESGKGGFFNLPPGPASATAAMGRWAPPLGETDFVVRADSITYANFSLSYRSATEDNLPLRAEGTSNEQ